MENKRILVVDDEETVRRLLKVVLTREGYAVEDATCGKEAVEKARRMVPDLVLMDLIMPDIDGAEAVAEIKSQEALKDVPLVLFVSGVVDDGDASTHKIKVREQEYPIFGKPIDIPKLLETVKNILNP